jgi:hypothetical protein
VVSAGDSCQRLGVVEDNFILLVLFLHVLFFYKVNETKNMHVEI